MKIITTLTKLRCWSTSLMSGRDAKGTRPGTGSDKVKEILHQYEKWRSKQNHSYRDGILWKTCWCKMGSCPILIWHRIKTEKQ